MTNLFATPEPEHFDVLIVGSGIAGVGLGCRLEIERPGTSYAVLEARADLGGTWDLFRYPGIRSDSDMFTLGYPFRPWTDPQAIAAGGKILQYVRETAQAYGVDRKIRYHHRVVAADWSSADARWTVTVERGDTGEELTLTCSWLSSCTGYYRYDQGYRPSFPGEERFRGQIVHPQHWPEDLDYAGKRVVVIGSGATAVTLVPSMTPAAAHVTMLQRTPTYVVSEPGTDQVAAALLKRLPTRLATSVIRWRNVLSMMVSYQRSVRWPEKMRAAIRAATAAQLPEGFPVDVHFNPPYNPWEQRLCLVPDGDLFRVISDRKASIVTDRIVSFTETGIELESGGHLEAEIIVTATGLNLLPIGGMSLRLNGRPVEVSETVTYKGVMFSGVPNFSMTTGYINASFTLKADLSNRYVCRLLDLMEARGWDIATPVAPANGASDSFWGLKSGFVKRGEASWPKQGARSPWRLYHNYIQDLLLLGRGRLEDEGIIFARREADVGVVA